MPRILDVAAVQQKLAALLIESCPAGTTVLEAGATGGKLLLLEEGTVEVVKDGSGSPRSPSRARYSAGSRCSWTNRTRLTFGRSRPRRSTPPTVDHLLQHDPALVLYLARVMALLVDRANRALIEVRRQVGSDRPGEFGRQVARRHRSRAAG